MFPRPEDLMRVLPELIWCGFGMLIMLLQPFSRSRMVFTTVAFLGSLLGTLSILAGPRGAGFTNLIQLDSFSLFFHLLIGGVVCLVVLAADSYLQRENL